MCKSQNAENKVENASAGNLGGNAKNVGNWIRLKMQGIKVET